MTIFHDLLKIDSFATRSRLHGKWYTRGIYRLNHDKEYLRWGSCEPPENMSHMKKWWFTIFMFASCLKNNRSVFVFQNLLHVLRKLLTHVSNFPIICWYASFSRILLIKSFLWMWMLLIPMGISCCSHCRPLLETAPFCIVMKLTNPLTERKDRPGKRYCKTNVCTWEQYFCAMPCKR